MHTTLIVVTYNHAEHIGACLEAVGRLAPPGPLELLVLDNGSRDGTAELVRQRFPHVRLLAEGENWGFAGGVNRAVAAAQGERIALLNPDAIPEPGWLRALLAPLDAPDVGVVGSKVLGAGGRIQSVGTLLDRRTVLTAHRGGDEPDRGQYDAPAELEAVHGAAMAFPRALWQELGGFDEGFFPAYWEEVDFCARARRAGRRVLVAPDAVVRHEHEASATGKYSAEFYGYYHRNRLRYAAKWLPWPELWETFRPAERGRLAGAPPLDRRVARAVYEAGVPPLGPLDDAGRAAVRALGQALRSGALPGDGEDALGGFLAEAAANAVLEDVQFRSGLPLVARLREAWNNVATRWYVRPSLDQQTRFNLAVGRALGELHARAAARAAADALDIALLRWRLGEETP
ncbi:MAG TPA: glycosyltransferase family 2 protein [Roseiflexaceae bacterium]|nr:glycosyltransferase family 2 protein [Roseiflexaceae bacterium]